MIRLTGVTIVVAFLAPLVVGILGSIIPAFGLMPSIAHGNGFTELFSDPRFLPSVLLSLKTGIAATLLTVVLTVVTLICVHGTRLWRFLITSLPPLLVVPHAAIAVGLIFTADHKSQ